MSESEVEGLRRAIDALSKKTDRQHEENQRSQERERAAFSAAMNEQRQLFQEALNKQFLEHVQLDRKVERSLVMLESCIGDGQPGHGRLGQVEKVVEDLKKFRWQAMAIIATLLLLADRLGPLLSK